MVVKKNVRGASRWTSDMINRVRNPSAIPVVYFTDRPNVGDLLNEYLIPRISGRKILRVRSSMQSHLRGIGSVIGSASRFSLIWGSGSIDGRAPNRSLCKKNIYALRGEHTQRLLSKNVGSDLDEVPLGDPAILMPLFFNPSVNKQEIVGIVPHFSDEDLVKAYFRGGKFPNIKVISVQQAPESFISELCSCKYIYSSSLHGLILADSYGIPNKWVTFSQRLLGGEFKFNDYYSTTISPDEVAASVTCKQEVYGLIDYADRNCQIKKFTGDKDEILNSFPSRYLRD